MDINSCRVCLLVKKDHVSLHQMEDEGLLLLKKLEYCMGVSVNQNCNLPLTICLDCLSKLQIVFQLKQLFLKNNKYLESFVSQEDVNIEVVKLADLISIQEYNIIDTLKSDIIQPFTCENNISEDDIFKLCAPKSRKRKLTNLISTTEVCYICDLKFTSNVLKSEHISKVHEPEEVHSCSICGYVTLGAKYLDIHYREHKVDKSSYMVCEFCAKLFLKLKHLKEHVSLVHSTKRAAFSCNQCDKKFKTPQNLRRHQKIHSGLRFLCDKCSFSSAGKDSLFVHLAKNHGIEARIKCPACKNAFQTMSSLRKHELKYQGECVTKFVSRNLNAIYNCIYCQKVFTHKSDYRRHTNSHLNNREFVCSCGKGFFSKSILTAHKICCENARKFSCSFCEMTFNKKENRDVHFRKHTGDTPYQCEKCQKSYSSRKSYTRHFRNVHHLTQKEKAAKVP